MKTTSGMNQALQHIRTLAGLMAGIDADQPVSGDLVAGCGRFLVHQSEQLMELLDDLEFKSGSRTEKS